MKRSRAVVIALGLLSACAHAPPRPRSCCPWQQGRYEGTHVTLVTPILSVEQTLRWLQLADRSVESYAATLAGPPPVDRLLVSVCAVEQAPRGERRSRLDRSLPLARPAYFAPSCGGCVRSTPQAWRSTASADGRLEVEIADALARDYLATLAPPDTAATGGMQSAIAHLLAYVALRDRGPSARFQFDEELLEVTPDPGKPLPVPLARALAATASPTLLDERAAFSLLVYLYEERREALVAWLRDAARCGGRACDERVRDDLARRCGGVAALEPGWRAWLERRQRPPWRGRDVELRLDGKELLLVTWAPTWGAALSTDRADGALSHLDATIELHAGESFDVVLGAADQALVGVELDRSGFTRLWRDVGGERRTLAAAPSPSRLRGVPTQGRVRLAVERDGDHVLVTVDGAEAFAGDLPPATGGAWGFGVRDGALVVIAPRATRSEPLPGAGREAFNRR